MTSLNNFVEGDSIAVEVKELYLAVLSELHELGYTWRGGRLLIDDVDEVINYAPKGIRLYFRCEDGNKLEVTRSDPRYSPDTPSHKLSEVFELCHIKSET